MSPEPVPALLFKLNSEISGGICVARSYVLRNPVKVGLQEGCKGALAAARRTDTDEDALLRGGEGCRQGLMFLPASSRQPLCNRDHAPCDSVGNMFSNKRCIAGRGCAAPAAAAALSVLASDRIFRGLELNAFFELCEAFFSRFICSHLAPLVGH